jgi:high-affinity nickel permease
MDGSRGLFDDRGATLHLKVIALYAILAAANLLAWAWAFAAFHGNALLLGTALLAYGSGSGMQLMPTTSPRSTMLRVS